MQPPESDPALEEIEKVVTSEERSALGNPAMPDDVKSEIAERLRRFTDADTERARAEDEY